MTGSLRVRLTLSFVLVVLLCVLMLSALANGVLESSFRGYLRDTLAQQTHQVVEQLGAQRDANGLWDLAGLTAVGMGALSEGLVVKLEDGAGRMVWDATVHNNGMCVQMINHMAQNMASRYPHWQGTYTEARFPVLSNFTREGTVTVGWYGPFYLNDQELAFITSLNRLLLLVGAGSLLLAVVVGLLVARRITVPLARVVMATQRITAGGAYEPVAERTGYRELDRIAAAVNELSRSLADQEALRRRLTADMAHELRTPLAALQSHVEALQDGVWEPGPARLEALHEEILRLGRLVADLERLARLEGDGAGLSRRQTDIAALLTTVVRGQEPAFREKGVTLELSAEPGAEADVETGTEAGAEAGVDPDRLSQAVINLLSNALKFTPQGGRVVVSLAAPHAGPRIQVTDTGIGIPAEHLPRVFERFYRVDASRARSTGGSGIGLSIAKAIVEAHGGKLTAASAPGAGSTFTIQLPAPSVPTSRGTSPISS